ncbi:SUMF1/EgtB/PvdO family nonheme iron enzyme [Rhabdochromatium marinum]|uniref:SUMF1/EgtB/PvdO family nonheme iron enzyme n=1 Tax=Rhabdochromatium marinum TaxID=48729 RepID=UPI00190855DC|nr:SUMF1/EgtB/PvdO family nonheme iron enzyme [Rhabdochromatium marinum]
MSNSPSVQRSPRVFISYSHDSDAHRQRVLALSERLRKDGIDADLDQYVQGAPAEGWPRWMLNRLDWADFVLLICTPTYYHRFRGHEEPGNGKGVDWESAVITDAIYDERSATLKFVPLLFDPADEKSIPEPVRGHRFYCLSSAIEYQALYDFLLGQSGIEPRTLDAPKLKARERAEPQRTRRLHIPDITWVEIPGGPFVYRNGEIRELPTFWIARYPVTNAQYQTFIDDRGYEEPRWWEDLKRPKRQDSTWPQSNRPRTDLDWYEAVAFTRWLNARLGLPEGSLRLPTELEWEKAARGEQGRIYPWGAKYRSGHANVDEKGEDVGQWYLEQTTAVGLYPHGCSPYGVDDLAGNVWEWCLNKHDDVASIAPDKSGDRRALRGGSWIYDPDFARAIYRFRTPPGFRDLNGGFRLLSSVPIEPVR